MEKIKNVRTAIPKTWVVHYLPSYIKMNSLPLFFFLNSVLWCSQLNKMCSIRLALVVFFFLKKKGHQNEVQLPNTRMTLGIVLGQEGRAGTLSSRTCFTYSLRNMATKHANTPCSHQTFMKNQKYNERFSWSPNWTCQAYKSVFYI